MELGNQIKVLCCALIYFVVTSEGTNKEDDVWRRLLTCDLCLIRFNDLIRGNPRNVGPWED